MNTIQVLIPIFSIFAIGYIGYKALKIEIKPISTMALYLMSPILAFQTFYTNGINIESFYLGLFLVLLCIFSVSLCYFIGYIRRWDRSTTSGFTLASAFMNNGNYGTPLALLVFGTTGFQYAIILMVLQQLIMATVGIYIAARGSSTTQENFSPLKEVVKVPIIYGALLGVLFNVLQIKIGEQMMTAVDMVSSAAIPTIMIVLGMQLAKISLKKLEVRKLTAALVIKLAIAPIFAYFVALALPVDEMVKDIMVLMAAMPTAANTTMFALQFDAKPGFVSSSTLVSTLLTIITIPIVLVLIL